MGEKSPLEKAEQQRLAKLRKPWNAEAKRLLEGKTIVSAGYVNDTVAGGSVLRLMLQDGTEVFVMADDEPNGPGALHCYVPGKQDVQLLPQL